MSANAQSKYEVRKLSELKRWDENPKTHSEEGLARLKVQILELGVYKPLLINQNGIILGGNGRSIVLEELGIDEVMCSVVKTKSEAEMLKYALSDNDETGEYNRDDLVALVQRNFEEYSELEAYKIRLGQNSDLEGLLSEIPEEPTDTTDDTEKNKPPMLKITFNSVEDLQEYLLLTKDQIDQFGGKYTVTAGEL